MLIRTRLKNSLTTIDVLISRAVEMQACSWNLALLTFHGWVVWRLMSHTWHKVLYACMHPVSARVMGPSCIYVRTSHRVFGGSGSRGERWKSNYFFPISRWLPSCVRQIRLEKLRHTVLHPSICWEAESQSVNPRPLVLLHVNTRVITYPSSTSLWGDIGLILWASFLHHTRYKICPYQNLSSRK